MVHAHAQWKNKCWFLCTNAFIASGTCDQDRNGRTQCFCEVILMCWCDVVDVKMAVMVMVVMVMVTVVVIGWFSWE